MFRWNEKVNIMKIDVNYVKQATCGMKHKCNILYLKIKNKSIIMFK